MFSYDASSDDVRRTKYLDCTDEVKFGELTDAQTASFGDLLKAREVETTAAPTTTADSTVIVAGMLVMATALTLALRKKSAK